MTSLMLDRPSPPVEIMNDLTRRDFILGGLAAAVLVGACGGGREGAAGGGSDTITVINQFGTFDVPARPRRVVVMEGRRDLETAVALGLSPIAVGEKARLRSGEIVPPFIPFKLDDVEVISN